jgi:hypothetical protein
MKSALWVWGTFILGLLVMGDWTWLSYIIPPDYWWVMPSFGLVVALIRVLRSGGK